MVKNDSGRKVGWEGGERKDDGSDDSCPPRVEAAAGLALAVDEMKKGGLPRPTFLLFLLLIGSFFFFKGGMQLDSGSFPFFSAHSANVTNRHFSFFLGGVSSFPFPLPPPPPHRIGGS